jgi:hypothetical protein
MGVLLLNLFFSFPLLLQIGRSGHALALFDGARPAAQRKMIGFHRRWPASILMGSDTIAAFHTVASCSQWSTTPSRLGVPCRCLTATSQSDPPDLWFDCSISSHKNPEITISTSNFCVILNNDFEEKDPWNKSVFSSPFSAQKHTLICLAYLLNWCLNISYQSTAGAYMSEVSNGKNCIRWKLLLYQRLMACWILKDLRNSNSDYWSLHGSYVFIILYHHKSFFVPCINYLFYLQILDLQFR